MEYTQMVIQMAKHNNNHPVAINLTRKKKEEKTVYFLKIDIVATFILRINNYLIKN